MNAQTHTAAGILMLVPAVFLLGCNDSSPPEQAVASPKYATNATYVGRGACIECHESQSEQFAGSDHDRAIEIPTHESVLGDFDNAEFSYFDEVSTFISHGGSPAVRTRGPNGEMGEYPIAYTFGVEPLQQYLIELGGGRYGCLGIAWDSRPEGQSGQRWYHLYPDDKVAYDEAVHWTGPMQNWNHMCAECHSTNLQKNYDEETDTFATSWSEIDVSCEACHGPASEHVAWANAGGDRNETGMGLTFGLRPRDGAVWMFEGAAPTATRPPALQSHAQIETCARCHSRRSQVWEDYEHGQPLAQTHRLALLDEGLYHADGQIRDEVYVYGSFIQSKMYHKGVTCTDCHSPHTSDLYVDGNALCARCHTPEVFDTPSHHRHEVGSAGASCVECHMPSRRYMGVDDRRDHSMRVPRPDLSVKIGTPNACTDCHADQSAQWALDAVNEWHGPGRTSEFHYATALDAGRRGLPEAGGLLRRVAADPDSPSIARASAVDLLGDDPESRAAIKLALQDDDPLVRRTAAERLEMLEPGERWRVGSVLLIDSIRTVRLAAVVSLAGVPSPDRTPDDGAFDAAAAEFRASHRLNADRADAWFNLGNFEAHLGRINEAARCFENAIDRDRTFIPAYVNQADLFRALGRDADGELLLREALTIEPNSALVRHSLGLLLVRQRRVDEALDHLGAAARLETEGARYALVYSVALHDTGRPEAAIDALGVAQARAPSDRDVLRLLIIYNAELGRRASALAWAYRLDGVSPGQPDVQRMIESLRGDP